MREYVIIGTGIAALSAAKAIREYDSVGPIHMVGDESGLPYKRLRLTKDLFKDLSSDNLMLQKKEWYEDNAIHLHLGIRAESILIRDAAVMLSDGSRLPYDRLLLANGSENSKPPIPGIEKQGIFTLRTLEDAGNIIEAIKGQHSVLMIGGGVLGLEIAWCLLQAGKQVVIAEVMPRLMPKQLDEDAAGKLAFIAAEKGAVLKMGTGIRELTGNGRISGYITMDGDEEPCDIAIYSTGIKPRLEIVKGTDIAVDNGIVVNDRMETNRQHIYAAGDIASFHNEMYGLWSIAGSQGETAGCNMAGGDRRYRPLAPSTHLNAFGITLFSIGDVEETHVDKTLISHEGTGTGYKKLLFQGAVLRGAIVIGDNKAFHPLKTAIEQAFHLPEAYGADTTADHIINLIRDYQGGKQPVPVLS